MTRSPISARVATVSGQPTLFINDKPAPPILYGLPGTPGPYWQWEESVRAFAKAGIHLHQIDLGLYDFWLSPDEINMDIGLRALQDVIDADPEGAIMLRFHINAPHWWDLAHPDECVAYADTTAVWKQLEPGQRVAMGNDLSAVRVHSFASELWRAEASRVCETIFARMAASPQGARVFCLQIADGVYGENHPFGFLEHDPDVSEPMRRAFSRFLKARYADDEALRRAWSKDSVTLDHPPMPDALDRERTSSGALRVPSAERWIMDYYACLHDVVSDVVLHFCGLAKQAWGRPVVTAAFYGYFYSLFGRQAAGGHLGIEKVLSSDKIDILCAPQSYLRAHRARGGSGQTRLLMESARLHGKLTLDEMDQPPHSDVVHPVDRDLSNNDMRESLSILRRNVLTSVCRGMGMWYYDFGPTGHAGWWLDDELRGEIGRLQDLTRAHMGRGGASPADVLVVYDEKAFYLTANNGKDDPVTDHIAVNQLNDAMFHCGAAFDSVYLFDLKRVDISRYRAVVFANTYDLGEDERAYIARSVARDGRHVIYVYADGLYAGGDPDTANIRALTGMNVIRRDQLQPLRAAIDPAWGGGDMALDLSYNERYFMFPYLDTGKPKRFSPNFIIDDPSVTPVTRYAVTENVCGARREANGATVWYFAVPPADNSLLRSIFREAGAHIYEDRGDALQVGAGLIVLHTAPGGERQVRLRNGKAVELTLAPCETAVLDAGTGERLM